MESSNQIDRRSRPIAFATRVSQKFNDEVRRLCYEQGLKKNDLLELMLKSYLFSLEQYENDIDWKTLIGSSKPLVDTTDSPKKLNCIDEIKPPISNKDVSSKFTYIYIMKNGEADEYKIGYSKNPNKRISSLRTGNPHIAIYKLIKVLAKTNSYEKTAEKKLHDMFDNKRIVGEWFLLDNSEIKCIESAQWRERNNIF